MDSKRDVSLLLEACRIPATKRETLARFLPQTAKPEISAAKSA
jgi:hypothetical protein